MGDVVLSVNNISKSFGGVHALKNVSMDIRAGEIHCLAGENGSGKSTLIKIISGYHKADGGTIHIDGEDYESFSPSMAIEKGIQVIYQDFSLFPNLSVMENLAINSELARGTKIVNWKRMREIAEKAVASIQLKVDMKAKVADLPVADKQMIAIARALVHQARVMILDEATASLTRKEVNRLFSVIEDLRNRGVAIVFVSHKLDEVFEISDTITVFRNGMNVGSCPKSEMTESSFYHLMTGKAEDTKTIEKPVGDAADVVMKAEGLSVDGSFSDVSFELYKGEILGVAGQLGSGRAELTLALFGLANISNGKLYVKGKEVHITNVSDAQRLGLGYVPEDRLTEGLFLNQSIRRNIAVTHIPELSNAAGIISEKKTEAEAEEWIDRLSIVTDSSLKPARNLSGGNQQKVALAKWLSCGPEIMVLNGPTVGVDIGAKHDIYELLSEYARSGMSIIIASDDIRELLQLCNRVLVMRNGRISRLLCGDEITEEALTDASI